MFDRSVYKQTRRRVTGCDHERDCAVAGIGAAIVRRFLDAGARVVIADLDEAAAHESAKALGERAVAMHCDVTCAAPLCQRHFSHGNAVRAGGSSALPLHPRT